MNCSFNAAAAHSRALLRRARARSAGESGQSLMEVVLAMMIFAIVATAMIILLMSAVKTSSRSRQKTLAQQAAATQIEQIRNTPYPKIGNTTGNPPGNFDLITPLNLNGLTATQTTKISYVNDPTPLSYQSYANYKKVSVTVTRASDGHVLARDVTYIAPPVKASQSEGQITATVSDPGDANNVVPNVEVHVTGPNGFSASDTTDNSGQVTFAALTPTGSGQYYDVNVVPPPGYVVSPASTPPAAGVHFALAPTENPKPSVEIYKPATIYVQLLNSNGTAYPGTANVTISSTNGSQTVPYSGTQLTVTTLNGAPLRPGISYTVAVSGSGFYGNSLTANVPSAYPTNLTSTFSFTNAALASLQIKVQKNASTPCSGWVVTVSGGPWNLGGTNPALTATTDTSGTASFSGNVPVGSGYAVKGKKSFNSGTASITTIAAGSNSDVMTVTGC